MKVDSRYRIAKMLEQIYMLFHNNHLESNEHGARVVFRDHSYVMNDIMMLQNETAPRDINGLPRGEKIEELSKAFQEDRIEELELEVKELRKLVESLIMKDAPDC